MTPHDPFGYHAELDRAAAGLAAAEEPGEAALGVVVAWGYCLRTGTPVPPAGRLTADQLAAARAAFAARLAGWGWAAAGLSDRWYECDSPADADDLCEHWLDRRTEVWAAEAGFAAAGVPADVGPFDAALRAHEQTLATVAGLNWWANHRHPFVAAGTAADAWWLNDHLPAVARASADRAAATLPSAGYYEVVRRVRQAKRAFPAYRPAGLAADAVDLTQSPPPVVTLRWRSADGRGEAWLNLPAESTPDDEAASRPLNVHFAGRPAAGVPVRLGAVAGNTGPDGKLKLTLVNLRPSWDGRLFVGSPEEEWPLEPDGKE